MSIVDDRPLIYVLDDGKPELRFSLTCPNEAAMVDRLIESEYDIGLSAGRNRPSRSGPNPMVIFSDDDHVVAHRLGLMISFASSNRAASIYWQLLASNPIVRIQMNSEAALFVRRRSAHSSWRIFDASVTLPSAHSFVTASLPIATSYKRSVG